MKLGDWIILFITLSLLVIAGRGINDIIIVTGWDGFYINDSFYWYIASITLEIVAAGTL